ncbi:glycerol-3-phosphate dehydrogenase [NAD(P)+] [Bryobacterales bacterium F-183]|nr:glycerol-3-phosphate dehydrogenase [NAD(P)+] [Bryobacterales bacterium F-183]
MIKTLTVVGAGAFGTAMAIAFAPRVEKVRLWAFEKDVVDAMQSTGENAAFLPGFRLPANLSFTSDLRDAVTGADCVLGAMPSQHARRIYSEMRPYFSMRQRLVSATKGIENGTLLRMSQVIEQVLDRPPVAVLTGPSFAKELAAGLPSAMVVASTNRHLATEFQETFSGGSVRLYTQDDPIGCEIGASIKNVVSVASGIVTGLRLGHNTTAALITRGLREMTRLAEALGGRAETMAGLAGLGDLVLTCTGDLSRNRRVGILLAEGQTLEQITGSMRTVAEGVHTTYAAYDLAVKHNLDLPIVTAMYQILKHGKTPRQAIHELMERPLKGE